MTAEGSATYINSPIDYNSYDGLPYVKTETAVRVALLGEWD